MAVGAVRAAALQGEDPLVLPAVPVETAQREGEEEEQEKHDAKQDEHYQVVLTLILHYVVRAIRARVLPVTPEM